MINLGVYEVQITATFGYSRECSIVRSGQCYKIRFVL